MKQITLKHPSEHLYGEVLKSRAVTEFTLTETTYAPNLELPKHSHDRAYFCLVLQGTYTEAYGNKTRLCQPASLIFHPPDEIHSDRFYGAGGRCFNVQINPRWLERVREHSAALDRSTDFQGGEIAHLAVKLYREFRAIDEASPLAIEGLTLEILAEASRRSARSSDRRPPHWLVQARELLRERFSEHLPLTAIAASVGVHPVHLAREFRKHYHLTIGEYVRQLRIEFACCELSESTTPLIEVALAAGFSHQSHFSRTFKRLTGLSPAEYRMVSRLR